MNPKLYLPHLYFFIPKILVRRYVLQNRGHYTRGSRVHVECKFYGCRTCVNSLVSLQQTRLLETLAAHVTIVIARAELSRCRSHAHHSRSVRRTRSRRCRRFRFRLVSRRRRCCCCCFSNARNSLENMIHVSICTHKMTIWATF